MMKCCPKCFGDRGLKKEIFPILTTDLGECSFCGSLNQALVDPIELRDYFEQLISIYQESDKGATLAEWLKKDWLLFDHPSLKVANVKELLSEILNDGEIVRKTFVPINEDSFDHELNWKDFKEELLHHNRFFPKRIIDEDRLEELLSTLIADTEELTSYWYRTRIQSNECAYDLSQMGAPPQRLASLGRANPAGIPYLYLASDQQTSVSEVRPHPGETACIAKFSISNELKLVDLRMPRKLVSPFLLIDEQEVSMLRNDIGFLERLGLELTTPVLPRSAAIDYIPTQYLCEFIKKCGYNGVLYLSSISKGYNLALFNPIHGQPIEVSQLFIEGVNVHIRST